MPTLKPSVKPSSLEYGASCGHGPSLPKEEIQLMPYEAQQRLFQFLLVNPTPLSSKQLLYANKIIFKFTDKNLAELCVAKARFDVLIDILNCASETKNDFDKAELMSSIYDCACEHGFLEIIMHLETMEGFNKETAAHANHYAAYQKACKNGHFNIIYHLEAIHGFDKKAASSALNYAAYLAACENGQRYVIDHLEEIERFDRKAASSTLNYAAYRTACENGHLIIINHLEKIEGFNTSAAASYNQYEAYRNACENGHLNIVNHLENIDGFDKKAAARADFYKAFRGACENGHLHIVKHFKSINGFNMKTAASDYDFAAYRSACIAGHLNIIVHLEQMRGFDRLAAASAKNYHAYRSACATGRLNVIAHLENIDDFNKSEALSSNHYEAYCNACENGHINIINHLQKIILSDISATMRTISYDIYSKACAKGQLNLINQLEKIEGFNTSAAASYHQYEAYRNACENGHLNVIHHLGEINDFHDNAAASIDDYLAYRAACANGHLNIIEHLATISGFDERMAARFNHDEVYTRACENGHLNVMKHLEKISDHYHVYNTYVIACKNGHLNIIEYLEKKPGFKKDKAVRAMLEYNDEGLRITCQNQRTNIINHLLVDTDIFQVMENHNYKFDAQYLYNFVDASLRSLQTEKERFQTINPNAVFDVTPGEAKRYIYMLKHLSRRGIRPAENLDDKMFLLLSIPRVKALCHQRISDTGEENELLKVAMNNYNSKALQILLSIPDVYRLAIENDYYQNLFLLNNLCVYSHASILTILTQELIQQELRSFYQGELYSLLQQTQFTTDVIELILANYYRISAGLSCDYEQFHKLDIIEDKKSTFKETLKQKYGKKLEPFMALLDHKLTKSSSGDFLTFATAYDLTDILTQNLKSRPDSTANKIAHTDNMNDLINFLKSKPAIEGNEILLPRIFNVCMLPRQFTAVMKKLNHNELSQALQINSQELSSAQHQLLLLDKGDFELLLKNLAEQDIIKLLPAKDALSRSFLSEATISPNLKEVMIAHILSSVTLKKWLLSKEGMTHLFNITPQPQQTHHFFGSNTTRSSSHQHFKMKLVRALSTGEIRLSNHEVDEVKMSKSLNANLQLIANAKGINLERLYNSISSNDKPYTLTELKGLNAFE